MKKYLLIKLFLLLIFVIIYSCNDKSTDPHESIPVKPIVKISFINYDEQLFNSSFAQKDIINKISDFYKSTYSNNIKNKLIDYVTQKVESLGENKDIFMECFNLTGCENENSISLPTFIEKAKYNGEDAWIIQLTWGMESSDLGHYKSFAIGINSKDTLCYSRCK